MNSPKQSNPELSDGRLGPQRHKTWNTNQRPSIPRTPKQHRLSVDSNIQIPEALNSASKRNLLRKVGQFHFLHFVIQFSWSNTLLF